MIQGDSSDPGSAASWGQQNTGNVGMAENAANVLAPQHPAPDLPNPARGGGGTPAKPKAKKKPRKPAPVATPATPASRSTQRAPLGANVSVSTADWGLVQTVAHKYGIDPYVLVAIGLHETGWGTQGAGRDGFALGVGVPDSGGENATYHGLAAQLDGAARILAKYGVHTIQDLATGVLAPHNGQVRYASGGGWTSGVVASYNQIKGTKFTASTSSASGAATIGASASGTVALDNGQLEKSYGSIASLLKDTALQKLVGQAVANGWDDATFTAKLQQSDFYRKHSDIQRNWLMLKVTDPGEAQNELRDRERDISKQAMTMGITMAWPDIRALAESTLYNGQTGNQINDAVGAHFQYSATQHGQGQAGTYQDQFTQLAQSYGVPVSDVTIGGWVQKVLGGQMTPDTVKSLIEQQALTLYPGLSTQIKSGQTTADVASTYRDTMSNLLELNPASVTLQDPTIKKALQYSPDPTKPPTLMPMWQFEQNVRQDPRWLNTQNAKQSVMGTGLQILKDWGLFSG